MPIDAVGVEEEEMIDIILLASYLAMGIVLGFWAFHKIKRMKKK